MALQVDILVVNCSVFNPTPSLAAAVINQFRLKPTVITYNLSGMGCSAGLLSIALVRELLQVRWQGPHFLLTPEAHEQSQAFCFIMHLLIWLQPCGAQLLEKRQQTCCRIWMRLSVPPAHSKNVSIVSTQPATP